MEGLLGFIKSKKGLVIGGITLALLIVGFLLPNVLIKWNINKIELDKIDRIEYIEYEGEAFSSPILVKRAVNIDEDRAVLEKLMKEINLYKKSKNFETKYNRILFFYHKSGEVFNAYVAEDLLGFNYGQNWIKAESLKDILKHMDIESNIKTIEKNE